MMREYQVRICERLGVKFPGPTRQSRRFRDAPEESGPPPITDIRCQRLTLIGLDLTVRRYRAPSISVAAWATLRRAGIQ